MDIYFTARPITIENTISHLIDNQELLDTIVWALDGGIEGCDISLSKEQLEDIIDNLKERKRKLNEKLSDIKEEERNEELNDKLSDTEKALDILLNLYKTFDFDNYELYFYYDY